MFNFKPYDSILKYRQIWSGIKNLTPFKAIDTSPYGDRIFLHIGDAADEIAGWEKESVDLAFIDADKREYCDYYRLCFPLIKKGGYIIADNTLWDGHVTETTERHSAQTLGIMAFNDMVASDPRVEKVIIPLRDGLTIIRKL